jgi:nucleotide-binding universal stress UspA family protein
MFEKILVPLNGSGFSNRTLPYAIEIARRFSGKIILFEVVSPTPAVMAAAGSPHATQMVVESAKTQEERNLARSKRFPGKTLKESIGLKRSFMGSVADEVVRKPGIPVLAIRPDRRIAKK